MNIVSVASPVYSKVDNSTIDCVVTFDTVFAGSATHPYTASAADTTSYGEELWAGLVAGSYGAIGAYVAPTIPPGAAAGNAINAGIILTSTGTPALNGTYAVNQAAQANINAISTYILVNGNFPGGGSTLPWYDTSGVAHTFPSTAAFQDFASAVATFVAAVAIYANSNGESGSLPSNALTIP